MTQRMSKSGESVFDARRDLAIVLGRDDAAGIHLLEMLDQHLLADPGHVSAQVAEAACLIAQRPQDEHLPFPADDLKCRLEAAAIFLVLHLALLRTHRLLP